MAKAKQTLMGKLLAPLVQRALYDLHPELLEREPLMRLNSEDEAVNGQASSFTQSATSYTNHMWLQKAINVLSNNIAPLPLKVTRISGQDTEWLDTHPIQPLLDNPNPEMGSSDLWREWVITMMLGGEIGLEAVRNVRGSQVLELWPKQPEMFTIKPDSMRYRRPALYKIDDGMGEPYSLKPTEFIHFKFYNPLQPFRGLSPATAIRMSIVIDQLAQVWSRLFFKNQARPDYAIIAPEGLTSTERKEIESELAVKFGGNQAHKPIVLEQGISDIKTFSYPAKDIEWVNQREMSRDEVAAIVGVPDEIMGYGKDTYENFTTAERVLWTLTIVPLTGLRDGVLTRWFRKVGLIKPNEKVQTDLRQVPQLQEDRSSKITQAKVLFDMGVPVNMASEYLGMGLQEVPGGDTAWLPMGLVPAGQETPEPVVPSPSPAEEPSVEEPPAKAIRKDHTEYGSVDHETLWKGLQSRIDKPTSELQRLVKKEFQRQQNEINRKLREGKIFGRGLYKADPPPPPHELFDMEDEIKKFIEAFKDSVFNAAEAIGNNTLTGLGLRGSFDISRPTVVAAVRGILEQVARKTNESTWNDLVELFREAEQNGEGIPQIQERLSAYYGDRKSDWQTERIARTTMTGAANAGSVDAVAQAQDDYGLQYEKEWISALQPNRSRESHMEAHGQRVGLNENFTVDGEDLAYPGDPLGSPGNIINCLCGTIFVEKE